MIERSVPPRIEVLGSIMRIDATAADVTRALTAAGVRSIVLKGPSIARWLYTAKEERPYYDCDVLVSPGDMATAEQTLRELGYRPYSKQSEWDRPQHGMAWVTDGHLSIVDLHRSLGEATADPATVWEVLSQETEWLEVAGTPVEILNEPARALHVAAHLAQHGGSSPATLEDMRRAVRAATLDVWQRAVEIAIAIGALDELVSGLRAVPEGAQLLHELGLGNARGVDAILRELGAPPLSRGINWMRDQPLRAKVAFVLPNVFPSKPEMRDWSPLARRGPVGLALAYAGRPFWMLGRLPRAIAAVRAARREQGARLAGVTPNGSQQIGAAAGVAEAVEGEAVPVGVSLAKNFSWTMAGNAVYAASQWAAVVVLAQLQTPRVVGQYALGLAISAPVIILANLALRQVLATDTRREYLFGHYRALRVVTSSAAMVAIGAVCLLAGYDLTTSSIVVAVGLSKAFDAVSDIFYGLDQLYERMDVVGKSLILRNLLSIAVLTAGVVATGSVLVGALASAGASMVVLLFFDLPVTARVTENDGLAAAPVVPARRGHTLRVLARKALPLGLATSLVAFSVYVPRYFVERSYGARALGIFSAIVYIGLATDTAVQALGQTVTSRFARLYSSGDIRAYARLLLKLLALAVALGAAGVIGALLFGEWALDLLYGPAYAERADVLVWALLGAGIQYVASFLSYAVMATRAFERFLLPYSLVAVAAIASAAILVPSHGLVGAAWSYAIVGVVNCAISIGIFLTAKDRPRLRRDAAANVG